MGYNRAINREKLGRAEVEAALMDRASLRARVFHRSAALLRARAASAAFHPAGAQEIVDCGEGIFAVRRISPAGDQTVLCLHNLTKVPQMVEGDFRLASGVPAQALRDLITDHRLPIEEGRRLGPFQSRWLSARSAESSV